MGLCLELTAEAKKLMAAYSALTAETTRSVEEAFHKHFGEFLTGSRGEASSN